MPCGSSRSPGLLYSVLCALVALQSSVIAAVAQLTLSADTVLPEVFTFRPGQCRKFKLEAIGAERQVYYVLADVTSSTGGCNSSQILQTLPQNPEHFALAEYDQLTTCEEVREKTPRGRFSTKKELSLDFVPLADRISALVPYTVCMDTSWKTGDFAEQDAGPLQTYVFLENRCTNGSASVAIQLVRDANASADVYCDQLKDQSSGTLTVEVIYIVATVMVTVVLCLGYAMCTACCSCWCCCARSGRCATGCSRSCYACWGSLVNAAGLGWIMDRAGGLTFYTSSQGHPLLFWAFAASCLTVFQIINLPRFNRDDTINPERRDSRTTWGPDDVEGVPAVRFILSLITSFVESVAAFGVVPVVFSDPVRDPSFRSKVTLAGVLLIASNISSVCVLLDIFRYYHLWPRKPPQIMLQIGVFVSHFMVTFTYFLFLRRSIAQRKALRAKLKLPASNPPSPKPPLPAAAVAAPPPAATSPGRSSGRRAGPVAEGAQDPSPQIDSTDEPPSLGGSATLTLRSPATFQDDDSNGSQPHEARAAWRLPATDPPPGEINGNVADGDLRRVSQEKRKRGSAGGGLVDATASEMGSVIPLTSDEVEGAAQEPPRGCAGAAAAFLRQAWDGVKEEPDIGFRYSSFFSASLLVAAVTTTSSLLRAGTIVVDLADCTDADSECLFEAQRWVYNRFLRNLVRIDPSLFEAQASGVCDALLSGAPVDSAAASELPPGQALAACQAAQALQVAQEEQGHPEWLREGRTPMLVGGFAAVIIAYCISMYTIYHVAGAYKKLEVKLKAARLAEVLWHSRTLRSGLPSSSLGSAWDRDSTAGSSSVNSRSRPTARTARAQLGKDILKDYETVSIGQSAYFTGTLVSTCFFQLWLGALVLGAVLVPLLHPSFWRLIRDNIGWVISFFFILAWHILSQLLLNRYVTDGKRIRRPFMWLFLYIGLSTGYCVVAILLAAIRLAQLVLTSILALSRLDSCLFTVLRGRDRGYASFLAMALMLHSFQQCLKETAAGNEVKPGGSSAVPRGHPAPAPAVQSRWRSAAARAMALERTRAAVLAAEDAGTPYGSILAPAPSQ